MELYYARTISNSKSVCISTLTDEQLADCGALNRFGSFGYYLYERVIEDGDEEIEVLAHISSDEAARFLADLLGCIDPRTLLQPPLPQRPKLLSRHIPPRRLRAY